MNYDFTKRMVFPLMLVALVAGCDSGKDKSVAASTPQLELAAKVNGIELPVQQVDQAVKRGSNSSAELSEKALFQAVRNLVDQEVIAQKAVADKLDQDPQIKQALEMTRRKVLAEAYMSRKLGTPAEPGDAEVAAYFDAHPELFDKRKIYSLQELSIKADKEKHESIRSQLVASKTLNDFAVWLKKENFSVKAAQGVKAAEQIPLEILPKLAQMPDGQAIIVNSPDGLLVIVLADSQLQPVTMEQAKPVITRMLQTQARQKAAKAELDALKSSAKIEFFGKFSGADKQDAQPVAVEPASPPTPSAPPVTEGK